MQLEPGDRLHHFGLVEKLGEGGMGVVWRARDTRLDRPVAIKVLADSSAGIAPLMQEARTVAGINHPNIVTIHAVEDIGGHPCIVMELVEGRALNAHAEGRLSIEAFLELATRITDGVAAAHERGIVHRDLKPGNILVTPEGIPKILDFGLARALATGAADDESTIVTTGRGLSGTIPYMSPEQAREEQLEPCSDVFSLGVIFYELLAGTRPFEGSTSAEILSSILRDEPAPLGQYNDAVPQTLGDLVRSCLNKDRRQRPASAVELRQRLRSIDPGGPADSKQAPISIAVLPFTDMSQNRDQDYFCEGIAEEIMSMLSRMEGLRLAARASSFQFTERGRDPREIGRRLGVRHLLDGSVRKAGDRLRITAQLVDVESGYQLWSDRFDRQTEDIFAIQDEIALNISRTLPAALETPVPRGATRPTSSMEAYEYYLRGRQLLNQLRRRTLEAGREMFERAVGLDPQYAQAYAGIADCCSFLFMWSDRHAANQQRAMEASRRALELAPQLSEAHAARGIALSLGEQYMEAETALEKAIGLDPHNFDAYYYLGRICFVQGKMAKTAELFERAIEVSPENYQAGLILTAVYHSLGRHDARRATAERSIALLTRHLELAPQDGRALSLGAGAWLDLGNREKALDWLHRSLELDPDDPMNLFTAACSYANAGESESALNCLERAVDNGGLYKPWLENDSDMDSLRDHPRFQKLLDRLV